MTVLSDTSSEASAPRGADIRTFLFADVRGYTRYTQDEGDEAASGLAARFADIVRDVVPGFEGELLELRGDEALCVFFSARQALRAAVALQRRFGDRVDLSMNGTATRCLTNSPEPRPGSTSTWPRLWPQLQLRAADTA